MQKNTSSNALSSKEMQHLALMHMKSYLKACQCQSRVDVLRALTQWQKRGRRLGGFHPPHPHYHYSLTQVCPVWRGTPSGRRAFNPLGNPL